jgi:hypothetical protein
VSEAQAKMSFDGAEFQTGVEACQNQWGRFTSAFGRTVPNRGIATLGRELAGLSGSLGGVFGRFIGMAAFNPFTLAVVGGLGLNKVLRDSAAQIGAVADKFGELAKINIGGAGAGQLDEARQKVAALEEPIAKSSWLTKLLGGAAFRTIQRGVIDAQAEVVHRGDQLAAEDVRLQRAKDSAVTPGEKAEADIAINEKITREKIYQALKKVHIDEAHQLEKSMIEYAARRRRQAQGEEDEVWRKYQQQREKDEQDYAALVEANNLKSMSDTEKRAALVEKFNRLQSSSALLAAEQVRGQIIDLDKTIAEKQRQQQTKAQREAEAKEQRVTGLQQDILKQQFEQLSGDEKKQFLQAEKKSLTGDLASDDAETRLKAEKRGLEIDREIKALDDAAEKAKDAGPRIEVDSLRKVGGGAVAGVDFAQFAAQGIQGAPPNAVDGEEKKHTQLFDKMLRALEEIKNKTGTLPLAETG